MDAVVAVTTAAEVVARTRREQCLPPHVEDPVALAAIAALVVAYDEPEEAAG